MEFKRKCSESNRLCTRASFKANQNYKPSHRPSRSKDCELHEKTEPQRFQRRFTSDLEFYYKSRCFAASIFISFCFTVFFHMGLSRLVAAFCSSQSVEQALQSEARKFHTVQSTTSLKNRNTKSYARSVSVRRIRRREMRPFHCALTV